MAGHARPLRRSVHLKHDISSGDADVRTLVIASREDLEITAGVEQVLTGSARS
jgi:hypothetical protein